MLRTEGLTKKFGNLTAVDQVDFELEEGEIVSMIGPNGAGKTTFFNLITGEYEPTSGSVYLRGNNITDLKSHKRVQAGLGRVFQISNLFPDLTTLEHVRLSVTARNNDGLRKHFQHAYGDEEVLRESKKILERLQILEELDVEANALSHGDKRRLEIGMAMAHEPDIILMDEPTSGLPDQEIESVITLIEEINDRFTIFLVEHKMGVVRDVSDRIIVLHNGEKLLTGTVEEIMNDPKVRDVYLGQEGA